jgi:hypothetical protein
MISEQISKGLSAAVEQRGTEPSDGAQDGASSAVTVDHSCVAQDRNVVAGRGGRESEAVGEFGGCASGADDVERGRSGVSK